jgi:hypothetical protein
MAVNKAKRSINLAQPQPHHAKIARTASADRAKAAPSGKGTKSERPGLNVEPELMPVKAHPYRCLAEMNNGLEQALHGLQELQKITYFSSSESLTGIHNLLSRIRAQANGEAMAVLAERETANARQCQQLCLEPENQNLERQRSGGSGGKPYHG